MSSATRFGTTLWAALFVSAVLFLGAEIRAFRGAGIAGALGGAAGSSSWPLTIRLSGRPLESNKRRERTIASRSRRSRIAHHGRSKRWLDALLYRWSQLAVQNPAAEAIANIRSGCLESRNEERTTCITLCTPRYAATQKTIHGANRPRRGSKPKATEVTNATTAASEHARMSQRRKR